MKKNSEKPDWVKEIEPLSDEKVKELLAEWMKIRKSIEEHTKRSVRMSIMYKTNIR